MYGLLLKLHIIYRSFPLSYKTFLDLFNLRSTEVETITLVFKPLSRSRQEVLRSELLRLSKGLSVFSLGVF
jgi:hypothetical protein